MIEWNRVTWYSRIGALVLFLGIVPALAFCIGARYGAVRQQSADLDLIAPVVETPAAGSEGGTPISGKIDINAVCEGALAYMTFPDAASADAFVAECKEGKHPEVIEHFKADMNLGDDAAI